MVDLGFFFTCNCQILPFKLSPTEICRNRAALPTKTVPPVLPHSMAGSVQHPEPLRTANYLHGTTVFSSNGVT